MSARLTSNTTSITQMASIDASIKVSLSGRRTGVRQTCHSARFRREALPKIQVRKQGMPVPSYEVIESWYRSRELNSAAQAATPARPRLVMFAQEGVSRCRPASIAQNLQN